MRKLLLILIMSIAFLHISVYAEDSRITKVGAMQFFYDGAWHEHDIISLSINNKTIPLDVPPIILQDRAVVPARAVFEEIGAYVEWNEITKTVIISTENVNIKLEIDNRIAVVNDNNVELDVPAKIINSRTLIPVRFVAETLGAKVDFFETESLITIQYNKNSEPDYCDLIGIGYRLLEDQFVIEAGLSNKTFDYSHFFLEGSPNRIVLDIANSKVCTKVPATPVHNNNIQSVRVGQFDENTSRIVIDVSGEPEYSIEVGDNTISIIFSASPRVAGVDTPDIATPSPEPAQTDIDKPDGVKTVAIDAGHGGKDPGTDGTREDGTVILEKDLNLDIALRLERILKEHGINVIMTRTEDVFINLYEIPQPANAADADLFVSIHHNSFTSPSANGTETWYYSGDYKPGFKGGYVFENDEEVDFKAEYLKRYGISDKEFASNVQEELIQELGSVNRKIKPSEKLIVTRESNMPSVLVEIGFLSNPEELERLCDEEYRERAAIAISKGVLKSLN